MDDLISRQAAIDALCNDYCGGHQDCKYYPKCENLKSIQKMPSAQPEIIRCKDCKYRDENWRMVSVKWLPCMDMRTGSNWYCGSAERGEQE